jgi:small subunit ribosomal protein S3Ae
MAPRVFGGKQVGQAVASKITELEGRTLEVPLSDLTGNFKHFATKVNLKVAGKVEGGLSTEYIGQELMRDQVSRNVRRWSSRIDGIQDITLKDGKGLRVKSLIITARRVNTAIKRELRAETFKGLQEHLSTMTLDEVVEDINSNKIQGILEGKLKKIYPVKSVNIRKTEVY